MNTRSTRLLKWQGVQNTLANAYVPMIGANRLTIIGRGNVYTREDDSTVVKIYNLQAFASIAKKQAAQAHWLTGYKLEKAGDVAGSQAEYKLALNQMMSFSVLLENSPSFDNTFEINCQVVEVPTREDENVLTLGINRPRPIEVLARHASDAVSFEIPTDETPATTPATGAAAPKGRRGAKAAK